MIGARARRLHGAAVAITIMVAVVNAVLAALGILSAGAAFGLWSAVEIPLAIVVGVITVLRIRSLRREGLEWNAILDEVIGKVAAHLIRFEIRGYRAIWLFVHRRYDGAGPGVMPVGYTRGTMGIPMAFLVACVIETAVVHVLVPWPAIRTALLVLSVWGLIQIFGILAGRITHPHLLTDTRLTIRAGHQVIVELDPREVGRAVARRRWEHTSQTVADNALYLPGPDGTCLDLVLTEPVVVRRPAFFDRTRSTASVSRLSLQVDDPEAVAAQFRAEQFKTGA
ncbi:hypothetical protein EV641_107202 [Rhodococcus sp. SMB37]|uniref:hypothetical protein n=1 Tax=Rhodococcus sp. SMB37 TaxID=2512213 RepID=UPI0006D265C7|nr:hypothetical protein [Rhodococcus sp. SMB37]TCN52843.1 hypothetical protein EV641_107202 [Rhodococcus sp. SMB37]